MIRDTLVHSIYSSLCFVVYNMSRHDHVSMYWHFQRTAVFTCLNEVTDHKVRERRYYAVPMIILICLAEPLVTCA